MCFICIGGAGKTALEWASGTGESAQLLREWAADYSHLNKGSTERQRETERERHSSTTDDRLRQGRTTQSEAVTQQHQPRLQGNPHVQSQHADGRARRAGWLIVAAGLLALLLCTEPALGGGRDGQANDDTAASAAAPVASSLLQSSCMESMERSAVVGGAVSNDHGKSLHLWRCLRTAEQQADAEVAGRLLRQSLWSIWQRWMTP